MLRIAFILVLLFLFLSHLFMFKILFGKDLQKEIKRKEKKGGESLPGTRPWPRLPPASISRGPFFSGPPDQPSARLPSFPPCLTIFGPTCQPIHPLPQAVFEQDIPTRSEQIFPVLDRICCPRARVERLYKTQVRHLGFVLHLLQARALNESAVPPSDLAEFGGTLCRREPPLSSLGASKAFR